jgi:hypothetical protein
MLDDKSKAKLEKQIELNPDNVLSNDKLVKQILEALELIETILKIKNVRTLELQIDSEPHLFLKSNEMNHPNQIMRDPMFISTKLVE